MRRHWRITLILLLVLTCYTFYLKLLKPGQNLHPSKRTHKELPEAKCAQLRSIILNSEKKLLDASRFFMISNALQRCSWKANHTARLLRQAQFVKCCNASDTLIVTQENTPLGDSITFAGEKKIIQVTESLFELFPKRFSFSEPIRSCAVVGNGGILKNSSCGADIDAADFVFRLNLAPMNWTEDVGTKTHLVSANPSILIRKHKSLVDKRKPFINVVKSYGSALVLMPAFSFGMNTQVSLRALHTLKDFDMSSKLVFLNPKYILNLDAYWKSVGLKFRRMSSGLILVSAAFEVCQKVTLYGFWPFDQDLEGIPIMHHYYDNVPPQAGMHEMPDEFYHYLQMHCQGALQLKLGQC